MIDHELIHLPIQAIDKSDDLYRISYGEPINRLEDSIKKAGLLNPPLVQKKQNGRYRIVTGFRRMQVVAQLLHESVPVFVTESNIDHLRLFEAAILDNISIRTFNPVEISIVLNKLIQDFGAVTESVINKYLPMLGLGINPYVVKRYFPLQGFEEPIKQAVAHEEISVEVAGHLAQFKKRDRLSLWALFSFLHPGKNNQRKLLKLCGDIARLKNMSIEALLQQKNIRAIVEDEKVSPPHRLEKLMRTLLNERYPEFSKTQMRYEALQKKLKLPPSVTISAPDHFEGEDYALRITFKQTDELNTLSNDLKNIAQNEHLREMINLT